MKNDTCGCGMPMPNEFRELATEGYNDALAATTGHMSMCDRFAETESASRGVMW